MDNGHVRHESSARSLWWDAHATDGVVMNGDGAYVRFGVRSCVRYAP